MEKQLPVGTTAAAAYRSFCEAVVGDQNFRVGVIPLVDTGLFAADGDAFRGPGLFQHDAVQIVQVHGSDIAKTKALIGGEDRSVILIVVLGSHSRELDHAKAGAAFVLLLFLLLFANEKNEQRDPEGDDHSGRSGGNAVDPEDHTGNSGDRGCGVSEDHPCLSAACTVGIFLCTHNQHPLSVDKHIITQRMDDVKLQRNGQRKIPADMAEMVEMVFLLCAHLPQLLQENVRDPLLS